MKYTKFEETIPFIFEIIDVLGFLEFPRIFPDFPGCFFKKIRESPGKSGKTPKKPKTSIISKTKGIVFPDFLYFIREVVIDNPTQRGPPTQQSG